ncbi:MAG: NAD(P)/FAD-dependent oxidoreductase [Thermoplasmata archaeon]|nr:NAD(P)/FAD-dependent oxidoreductase [Thermoplasmata archaeon]
MERFDALVIGAGPAGSSAAFELARRHRRVLVVEEHSRVGHPVQCAGLVSSRVLELAGSRASVLHPVNGAAVFSPALHRLGFRAAEPRAFVIDRGGLDRALAERAARAGAEFATGTRFDGFQRAADGTLEVNLRTPDGTPSRIPTRLLLGADGVASGVARAAGLRRRVEILPAFEAEFPVSPGDPEDVEVYLGTSFAPGLFGWWIPDGTGGARVGLAATAGKLSAREYFERMLDHLERRFGSRLRNPTSYLVSGIPIGHLPHIVADRVMLLGDAAAQVKPLSGGGIFLSQRAGQIAAETADTALEKDRLGAEELAQYPARFDAEVGEELRKALYLRRVFLRLTDADLEKIVQALDDAGLRGSIVAFGDIDFPSDLVWRLLRQSPSLLRLLPKAVGAAFSRGGPTAPDLEPAGRFPAR